MSAQTPEPEMTTPVRTATVLLEHTLPDGSAHLDWLIERPADPAEHRMITFRCDSDPMDHAPWAGERLPDHRAHYIRYEGPVSGNRGRVRRLWSHPCTLHAAEAHRLHLTIHIAEDRSLHLRAAPDDPARWHRTDPDSD